MYRTTFLFLACSALGLVASGALADPPSLDDAFSLYAELEEQGKYKEALPFAKQAVELAFKKYGQDHKATASLVYNLGILHDNLGEYELAEPLLSQALETGKRVLGPENQKTQKFEKTYKRFMAVRSLRRWTRINGKFTREARFVGLTDGIVGLRLESGSDINIALKDLSADDQETAARLQAILVDPREKGIRLPFLLR